MLLGDTYDKNMCWSFEFKAIQGAMMTQIRGVGGDVVNLTVSETKAGCSLYDHKGQKYDTCRVSNVYKIIFCSLSTGL